MDNVLNRNTGKWYAVNYFVNRCCQLLKIDEKQHDKLYEEFLEFNTFSDDEIDLADAILSTYEDDNIEYRWTRCGSMM